MNKKLKNSKHVYHHIELKARLRPGFYSTPWTSTFLSNISVYLQAKKILRWFRFPHLDLHRDVQFPESLLNPKGGNVPLKKKLLILPNVWKRRFVSLFDIKWTRFHVIKSFWERALHFYIRVLIDVIVDDQTDKISKNTFGEVANVDIPLKNKLFRSCSSLISPAFQSKICCTPQEIRGQTTRSIHKSHSCRVIVHQWCEVRDQSFIAWHLKRGEWYFAILKLKKVWANLIS